MSEPLILEPVFHQKIWGGTTLHDRYNFSLPSEKTGEAWMVSGHQNGVEKIKNGRFAGMSLAQLWRQEPALFENADVDRPFPLLVKLLDAHQDLSVQVHPDDEYAAEHQNELGKTESWYVVDAAPGAEIYYGHKAQTKAEFDQLVDTSNWEQLLQKVPVKAGDFFYVPAGTLHALGAGTFVLETQQSSDVTYRVYDFDRRDVKTGQLRELHLTDAKAVTTVPFQAEKPKQTIKEITGITITTLVTAPYFNVFKWELSGQAILQKEAPYTLVTVIDGSAELVIDGKQYQLTGGTAFVLPADVTDWQLNGQATLIAATPGFAAK
ncbi:mannose-6-phosphate isomerase [Weissella oryzae SG25]|uniref:Mannose-6-phosphate isomerase n=1 Tax=Weissella oryzae (strain DSM 25784 / JCM 18191 / LMG 30913 / SG25) TaxID=1329250 RepID=A0A069CY69_WEIOS|nr:mannose-6-phosphate isomerase, class I [Weissella oryzae]GAK30046.1 mannose-6-phosphate isomerase [Weissella oryzae SG25]